MNNVLQLNEFFVEGGKQFQSHVMLHITEPSTPEEQERGYFFAICEVNQADNKYLLKLQDIMEEIENGYYEKEDTAEKNSLEIVLDKANHDSFSLLKENISISCVVGAIRPPEIIFSFYGDPLLLLFYKNKEGEYKKMDLTKGGQEAIGDEAEKEYLFPQIIQGKVTPQDYLFLGTKHIIKYFDHDRLHKVITSRPPEQSSRHIEKVLSELKNGFSFGGMVIHLNEQNTAESAKPYSQIGKNKKDSSVNTLFVTEQNTESTLSPSVFKNINQKFKEIANTDEPTSSVPPANQKRYTSAEVNSSHLRQHRTVAPKPYTGGEKILWFFKKSFGIAQLIWQVILWLVILIWSVVSWLARSLGLVFFVITNVQGRRKNILQNWSRSWYQLKENYKNLRTITKILFFSSLAVVIIIIGSILYINMERQEKERTRKYVETLQNIKIKKDNAESSLIYNNETEARKELLSAKELLTTLPCVTPEEKNNCQNLTNQLEVLSTKIRHLTTVSPALLVDLSEQGDVWAEGKIIKLNNKIISFSPTSAEVFVYDLLTKEKQKIDNTISANGFTAGAVPKENDYALLLYNDKELARFNPEKNTLEKIEIFYTSDNAKIKDLAVYNRRLYTLDTLNNKIYRHDAIQTGFGQGKDWLKEEADFSLATGLAIEGDVFISQNGSQILRLTAGKMEPGFLTSFIDPELTQTNVIWTYTDLTYIYVLDAKEKRLVIFDKTGKFKEQITAVEFKNPTGMAVEETNKRAYIFDEGKLYQMDLP